MNALTLVDSRVWLLLFLVGLPGMGCSGNPDPGAVGAAGDSLSSANAAQPSGSLASRRDSLATRAFGADSLSASSIDRLADAIARLAAATNAANSDQNAQQQDLRNVTLGEAGDAVQHYGVRVFWSILVMMATYFFVRGLTLVLDKVSELSAERRLFYKRLVPILRVLSWSVALYFIVKVVFQVNTQSLLAAAAAIGVAIGFAAQDIVKNIFGGFVIITDRPFQVGDKIMIDGTYGEVIAIGLRSTRIVTPDDSVVTVPNAQVISSQVSNANTGALDCQVVTDLYLPGWVDEATAKRICYEAAASSKYVYLNKPIVVLIKDEFKETFITHIKVKAYVLDTRYEFLLMSDITERARQAFREAGLLRHMHGARAYVDLTSLSLGDSGKDGGTPALDPDLDDTAPNPF